MKAFQFRLDRVLDWRRTELEMEENRLKRMHAALAAIDRERAGLESARDQAGRALMARATVDGADLQLLSGYRAAVKLQCARLEQKRRRERKEAAAAAAKAAGRQAASCGCLRISRTGAWRNGNTRRNGKWRPLRLHSRNGPFRARLNLRAIYPELRDNRI